MTPEHAPATPQVPLRAPAQMMRLARLGSLHQCRLSFMRQLTRRIAREGWRVTRTAFDIDAQGVGHACYTADTGTRRYTLVCFAHDLPADLRSDRVIAEAWDATFTLFDGVPDADDIARLRANVPLQEAGRVGETELTLLRANRSVRLWSHVVDALAAGRQPDPDVFAPVGYLMRTTAVYGSGKFGAADREVYADRPELSAPFQAEMLSVWLARTFVRDLVQHMATAKGGAQTATLDPEIAASLGIGNSTGLGMAPFLVNHPFLLNNWIAARETAIARVRALPAASPDEVATFATLLSAMQSLAQDWHSAHPVQIEKTANLRDDLDALVGHIATDALAGDHPWDALVRWSETALSAEGQECLASLILEPYGDLVDGLGDCMSDPVGGSFALDGSVSVGKTCAMIRETWDWALDVDFTTPAACGRAWYVSAQKLEPRLGERFEEDIEPWEQPLDCARAAMAALACLETWPDNAPVAEVLLAHVEHRGAVRRAQIAAKAPYGEIRDNTIGADLMPIDMLRAKLSFFGATRFDPRSDRWVRITMYQGAPYPDTLTPATADTWVYPEVAS